MTEQRLPSVNSDDGQWGSILNKFLSKEHYNSGVDYAGNGGHQTITILPGSSASGTAPLKFTTGPLMTTPEAGAVEFNTDTLYFTQTTSTTRKKIAIYDDTSGSNGDILYRNSSGNLVRLGIGTTGQVLSVVAGLPAWAAATGGGSSLGNSFETVSKNLSAYPFTLSYNGNGTLASMQYTVSSNTITKTFNYYTTGQFTGYLNTIVLSGAGLPSGTALTKTLGYNSGTNQLNSVSYT